MDLLDESAFHELLFGENASYLVVGTDVCQLSLQQRGDYHADMPAMTVASSFPRAKAENGGRVIYAITDDVVRTRKNLSRSTRPVLRARCK